MRPAAVRRRAEAARLPREAERRTAPVEPLSTTWPDLDPADAYAVQQDNVARRLAAGSTVIGPGVTLNDVLTATDAVTPALEIVDSRIRDRRIAPAGAVADSAGSAGPVCGSWTPMAYAPDLAAVNVDLPVDGNPVATGSGKEVLGHPAAVVAWPADTLAAHGRGLDAGHVILPGAMATAPLTGAGQKAEARFGALGSVSVSFV
ncbi:2-keto-4-pentenoate hydratase [Streptomyces sp. NPDC056528]|uniref:2-keto-4-pentenoate hydratase n=1 Tax=Streptomyces sp. NPDC056528 TaxID=3345854 RepID=UPI0036BDC9C2